MSRHLYPFFILPPASNAQSIFISPLPHHGSASERQYPIRSFCVGLQLILTRKSKRRNPTLDYDCSTGIKTNSCDVTPPPPPHTQTHARTCVMCMCADNNWEFHWWALRTTLLCSSDCRLNLQWKTAFKTSVYEKYFASIITWDILNEKNTELNSSHSDMDPLSSPHPTPPPSVFPPALVNLPPPPAPSEVTWFPLHQQLRLPLHGLFMDLFSDTWISINA